MNKSPHYNQQTEPKRCKSKVEEICSYSPNPGNWDRTAASKYISENK